MGVLTECRLEGLKGADAEVAAFEQGPNTGLETTGASPSTSQVRPPSALPSGLPPLPPRPTSSLSNSPRTRVLPGSSVPSSGTRPQSAVVDTADLDVIVECMVARRAAEIACAQK